VDGRARFREIFCALTVDQAAGDTPACEQTLLRLKDEPLAVVWPRPPPLHDPRLQLVFVPGLYNECANPWLTFFGDTIEWLRGKGYSVSTLHVNSRSSSERNANHIAEYVAEQNLTADERFVLIGHSKGVVDILHFLVAFPEMTSRVAAVVSVAGAVNGSPLADWITAGYAGWDTLIPSRWCAPGDRRALQSLTRVKRLTWLSRHRLPDSVRYFSISAISDEASIAWPLSYGYDRLSEVDPRNDGLLLFYDQVIPGSSLLGYVHADHWRVAYPVEHEIAFLAAWRKPLVRFPRHLLLEAAMLYVVETLSEDDIR
jgi:hypothetical protein